MGDTRWTAVGQAQFIGPEAHPEACGLVVTVRGGIEPQQGGLGGADLARRAEDGEVHAVPAHRRERRLPDQACGARKTGLFEPVDHHAVDVSRGEHQRE